MAITFNPLTGKFDITTNRFTELKDVPSSYTGEGGKFLMVKLTEDGIDFVASTATAGWGTIIGDITDQTDLQLALGAKQDLLGFTPEDVANKDTTTSLGTSDTKYPSQNAVKTYADTKLPGTIATDTYFVTGMVNQTESTIGFNNGTTVFTIAPAVTNFGVWISSKKYTKTTETVTLSSIVGWASNINVYIYYNTSGELTASVTPWNIDSSNAPVATVFWNGTTGRLKEERHSAKRNIAWHQWAHHVIGTKYRNGLGGTFDDSSLSILQGQIDDEDIEFNIGDQTSAVVWYRTAGGAGSTFDDTPAIIGAKIVAGALKYDAGGTITSVTDTYFVRNYVYATTDIDNPIYIITGQNQYSNIDDCRSEALPVMPIAVTQELKLIYAVIWENVGGTPTFIESTDYRTSPSIPGGGLAIRPIYLNDLENVNVPSPAVDNFLRYNGSAWVPGSQSASATPGIEFFNASPIIIASGTENPIRLSTFSKTPVTTTEQTIATTIVNTTSPISAWLYDTVLNRTLIDAGVWDFNTYAGVNSTGGGRISTITRQIYSVLPQDGASITITITGTGTSRTVNASGGTPFATTKIDASGTNTVASYLQTPKGIYQITARGSDTQVTIATPTGYANESTVTFNVWKKLFGSTSPTITAITPAYALYMHSSVQGAFTITLKHKLGSITFGTTNNTTTITMAYDGTARNSRVGTPLITLHGNLAGLQGGTGSVPNEEYYHLTDAQHTIATQAGSGSVDGYLTTANYNTFNGKIANVVEDTTPQLGGELDAQAHSIGFAPQTSTGTGAGTTIDWKLGNKYNFTFGNSNEAFTFTAPSYACNLILKLTQYSTGGKTASWVTSIKWVGGVAPTLSTGNNAVDIISLYYDGQNYFGMAGLNFA